MAECLKNPNVLILFLCQSLSMSVAVMMISVGGTVGLELSGTARWSTLPITFFVFGTFALLFPASMLCGRLGRRAAFLTGAVLGTLGGVLFYYGVLEGQLWLVCVGTLLLGAQRAFMEYYRFAVVELVSESARAFALSLVVGGGVLAAVLGPWLAQHSRAFQLGEWFVVNFSASALAMGILCFVQILLFLSYKPPVLAAVSAGKTSPPPAPVKDKAPQDYQSYVLMAIVIGGAGFALMTLLMNAAPVAMQHEFHLDFDHAVDAIRWHVLAMFVPSFFTGALIKRFGIFAVSFAGLLMLLLAAVFGVGAQGHMQFVIALAFLGIGWNFCYLAGSYLIVLVMPASKKTLVEGVNNCSIYTLNLLGSFLAGVSLAWGGWEILNLWTVVIVIALLVWVIVKRRLLDYDDKLPRLATLRRVSLF